MFPVQGISGNKVLLRAFQESDITAQYLGWLHDPRVVRFSNQRFRRHDEASARAYLASFGEADNLFLSIRCLEDGRPIGTMTAYISRPHETADVGILIGDPEVWGKGLGQDAWNTLLDWLQSAMQIRKITAGTASSNYGMIRLMERSGMHHEATRRAQEIIEGHPQDIVYYARFPSS